MNGIVFDIKRFATHDGPGIRTTVFLKGCPLRCAWCHNPEAQDGREDIHYRARLCIGCGACVRACPNGALSISPAGLARNGDLCDRRGACADACPSGALSRVGRRMEATEVLAEVLRDRTFFDESGGGVTFSGGEPLAQPDFLAEMLELCGRADLHRAVDTCGYADAGTMAAIARRADLFLFDLKLMDSAEHVRHAGTGNDRILENLRMLCATGAPIEVRVPVIPGLTDTARNIGAMVRFLQALPRRLPVRLLPYHRASAAKYERFGIANPLPDTPEPSEYELAALAARFETNGFAITYGGRP